MNIASKRLLALLAFALAPLGGAHATVLNVGVNCVTLPAGSGNATVQYTAALSAPSGVMATIVTSQNAPLGTVTDNRGHTYPGTITRFNVSGLVFARYAQLATPISIGDTVTAPFTSIPPGGMEACVQLYASSDMLIPVTVDQIMSDAGMSTSISVTPSPTTAAFEVIHGAAFTLLSPGAVTTNPAFTNSILQCSGSNAICLLSATREVNAIGTYPYSATIANSRTWGAVITTYRRVTPDAIFKNDFE